MALRLLRDGRRGLALMVIFGLAGCTAYAPQPLDLEARGAERIPARLDLASVPQGSLRSHRFDPTDGLDMDEVAMLAVARNRQLKVTRDVLGETGAQAFEAGLLPTPDLSLSRDVLTAGDAAVAPFAAALNLNVTALLKQPAARDAARSDIRRARLELLWQEWQVINQARLLFVQTLSLERRQAVLVDEEQILRQRHEASISALRDHNRTLDTTSGDFVALQGVTQRRHDLERQAAKARSDLAALLDISPSVHLPLVESPSTLPDATASNAAEALDHLAERRPDLVALRWAYASQEAKVRQAVLGQFPSIGVAFTRARDNTGVYTSAFTLSLVLPLFNHNQGQIAIERATRQRLRDDFEQRLAAARAEVQAMLNDQVLIQQQLDQLESGQRDADAVAKQARVAFDRRDIDIVQLSQWAGAAYDKLVEVMALQESLQEQKIGLLTLLGALDPAAASSADMTRTGVP